MQVAREAGIIQSNAEHQSAQTDTKQGITEFLLHACEPRSQHGWKLETSFGTIQKNRVIACAQSISPGTYHGKLFDLALLFSNVYDNVPYPTPLLTLSWTPHLTLTLALALSTHGRFISLIGIRFSRAKFSLARDIHDTESVSADCQH